MYSFKPMFKNVISGSLIALGAISCICFPQLVANAQTNIQTLEQSQRVPYDRALISKLPSTSDDVGIAFLKMSNNFPDFSAIVKESDTYKKADPLSQADYLSKATNKLQNAFITFSPKKSDLIIRVKVNILFRKLPNGEGTMVLKTFPDDPVYFPFTFSKYPIAMIIQDMELFREIHLDKADTDIVYSRLSLSGDATLLLQLYAVAADDRKPILLDNIPQYPLLTDIAYIGFLNAQAEQIWAWRNPKLGVKKAGDDLIDMVPADKGKGFGSGTMNGQ